MLAVLGSRRDIAIESNSSKIRAVKNGTIDDNMSKR